MCFDVERTTRSSRGHTWHCDGDTILGAGNDRLVLHRHRYRRRHRHRRKHSLQSATGRLPATLTPLSITNPSPFAGNVSRDSGSRHLRPLFQGQNLCSLDGLAQRTDRSRTLEHDCGRGERIWHVRERSGRSCLRPTLWPLSGTSAQARKNAKLPP